MPGTGYGVVTVDGKSSRVSIHVLSNPNVVSHLCHRKASFNHAHLCLEANLANLARNKCLRVVYDDDVWLLLLFLLHP